MLQLLQCIDKIAAEKAPIDVIILIDEYIDKYGNIPSNMNERFQYLLKLIKFKDKDISEIRKRIQQSKRMRYDELSFVFYFTPQATPRPRYSRFTGSFYVKNKLNI